ncbi:hypothetical protein GCM10009836_49230 [Pseudonocardia ailaonensis]|uniref:Uncharacterized protein n=1 Tax=Pseudonocardia ailaonensis TaxID=367279 RepID=A0ABN2NEN1_9PSEU
MTTGSAQSSTNPSTEVSQGPRIGLRHRILMGPDGRAARTRRRIPVSISSARLTDR